MQLCSTSEPTGERIITSGIRYSNIEPDHDISTESGPTGVSARPAETEPVRHRHVALGDRDQRREARLRGKQVVAAGIEHAEIDPETDREELAQRIEEKPELHVTDGGVGERGERMQALPQRRE